MRVVIAGGHGKIAALLDNPGTRHRTLELTGGDTPVAAAVHGFS
jgi:hypothetical protein